MTTIPQAVTDYAARLVDVGDIVRLVDARFRHMEFTIESCQHFDGLTAADMLKRGWEPVMYSVRGKRGAAYMAFRSTKRGEFHWVMSLR